jgi:mRNA interferase RelE/StbE
VIYRISITPTALKMLMAFSDRRIREKVKDGIDRLVSEPEKQGKSLLGELAGHLSIRAVGQRYRIIYRIEKAKAEVSVVALGMRKKGSKADVYSLAKKLLRLKLLE